MTALARLSICLVALTTLAACTDTPAPYAPDIDPAAFTTRIDNRYFPLAPGSKWIYEGEVEGGTERTTVIVSDQTKVIMGVTCVVVRDTVTLNGEMIEDTFDWYAQHRNGDVWYFGKDTKEYDNGRVVSTKGAWEAGHDGGQPGIVMKAAPKVGDAYRQEFYAGEAEDRAEVIALDRSATTRFRAFTGVLVTKETTPLEPGLAEEKSYAPGVGHVLTEVVAGGSDRMELIAFTPAVL